MATRYSDNIIGTIKFTARSAVLEDYINLLGLSAA